MVNKRRTYLEKKSANVSKVLIKIVIALHLCDFSIFAVETVQFELVGEQSIRRSSQKCRRRRFQFSLF